MRRTFDRLGLRLRSLFRGQDVDRAMKAEILVHLEEQIDENIAAGMTPAEARRAALGAFGHVDAVEERCRDTRRVAFAEHLWLDLRYSFRSLVAQPLLLAAATVSIAVAIGANTTIVGLATSLLMVTPTARDPGRLVHIRMRSGSHVSYREWRDLSESGALAGLTGFNVEASINWRDRERSARLSPLFVTANFFEVLGVPLAMGRAFTAVEAAAEKNPALAVVSHGFWESRLNSDPRVLGSSLVINGRPYTVVGVLAPRIRSIIGFGLAPEVYLPVSRELLPDLDHPDSGAVELVGRLHDGQAIGEGRAALETAGQRLVRDHGNTRLAAVEQFVPPASPERLGSLAVVGTFFIVLFIAVALVLAIACANVAGLLLARATVRTREMAVRVALGASRGRLVQQLLTEGFWIAVAGTIGGVALMMALQAMLSRLSLPLPVPLELRIPFDARLFGYVVALTLLTTLMSALAPALQATKRSPWPALRQGDGRSLGSGRLRSALVVGQLAVALVLLVTASIFVRNLSLAQYLNPGFDTADSFVGIVGFVEGHYDDASRVEWLEAASARLREMPGVRAAGYALGAPLTIHSGMSTGTDLAIEGRDGTISAQYEDNFVGPGYFEALGIRLLKGRPFGHGDRAGSPVVIVINEEFARRYLGGLVPIGRRVHLPGADNTTYAAEIVGVVANSKHRSLGEDQKAAIYEVYAQRSRRQRMAHLFVRAEPGVPLSPQTLAATIQRLDPSASVEVQRMRESLSFAFLPSRVGAAVLGTLGLLGLVLAMGGLFAVVSYSVSRRTGEIGIRMALGASGARVVRLVLGDALTLTATGVVLGLAAAWFVTRPLAMFLVVGTSGDPVAFLLAAVVLILVSAIAAWGPARRAVRIDPVTALRSE
jgi:putative ABC transport system permease protein